MYKQKNKSKENTSPDCRQESRAVANSADQKKCGVKQGFGLVDNRPEALTQRKLLESVNNNPKVIRFNAKSQMANSMRVKKSQISANAVMQRANVTLEQGESVGKLVYTTDTEMKGRGETYKGILLVDISVPNSERNKGYGGKLMTKFMTEIVGSKAVGSNLQSSNFRKSKSSNFGNIKSPI